ncbi:MAG TPA: calcium-binding protein, partial [Actinomycetota bacterium]
GELGGTDDYDLIDFSKQGITEANLAEGYAISDEEVDTVEGFEIVVGSETDDVLVGDGEDNFIFGGEGADVIEGGDGADCLHATFHRALSCSSGTFEEEGSNDTLRGDAGDDVLVGLGGDDTYEGGPGVDVASFAFASGVRVDLSSASATGEGDDTLTEIEVVLGSPRGDEIFGDASDNVLDGAGGSGDIVRGMGGNDVLSDFGGDGTVDGGDGSDTITYTSHAGEVRVSLTDGTDNLGNSISAIENVLGPLLGRGIITGDAGPNRLVGGPNGDEIYGVDGDDVIAGAQGHDTLDGGAGTDSIDGGPGNDSCTNGEQVSGC